jgi:hypothetical protein
VLGGLEAPIVILLALVLWLNSCDVWLRYIRPSKGFFDTSVYSLNLDPAGSLTFLALKLRLIDFILLTAYRINVSAAVAQVLNN